MQNPKFKALFFWDNFFFVSSREKIKTLEKVFFIKETFCVASEGRSALGRRRREEKREPQRVVVVVVCESVFF